MRSSPAPLIVLLATALLTTGAANPVFVTSAPNGGWAEGGYYVHNNMWNSANYSPCTATLSASSHDNWRVVTRMNNQKGDGAVKTYPNVHRDYRSVPVSSFDSLTSTFAETSPRVGIYNFAYDLWLNGIAKPGCTEIMVWTENFKQVPGGRYVQDVTFDGRTYKVYKSSGSGYIAFVATTNFTSGTVNLLDFMKWSMAKGWLSEKSTLDQICYGVEVVSTDDAEATFQVSAFSIAAQSKPTLELPASAGSATNSALADGLHHLASPDNRLQVTLRLPTPNSAERPCWSAAFQGRPLLTNCTLGLQTADAGELLAGAKLVRARNRSENQRIPVLFGKADHANDHFRETRFTFETRQHRRLDVVFRCYNDAIAFRYELPKDAQSHSVTITDETTSFQVAGDPTAYAQYLENYTTSHEHNVTPCAYSDIRPITLLDLPLTLSWSNGTCMAVTEASLRHYAGMALMRPESEAASDTLVCRLTPRPDGTKVVRPLPMETPWRVVLVGDHPGALLESSTLYCLNEPSVIKDTSWIKPGKITFTWWNGDVYDGKPSLPILSVEMATQYIDFCARNGIPTHSLTSEGQQPTSPWYFQSQPGVAPGPDTDVTRPRADFDLPAIRAYANSKGVRLWTWVHQGALRGRVEEAFTAFEHMGWSGMMVDFFDHDDQDSIEFAESILQAAARHHLLIHFHGVWKPTGWQRTYPNLMNHEGALNLEYLKWSDRCTPEHDLLLAFTRLIAGPMDYHLGGFRAVTRAEFKPHSIAPNVLGTRGHQLALYVCFDNPNPMLADYPTAYEGQPGFDFLKLVPTWWDETRILEGKIGEVLVTARRQGNTWYLGGLSAKQPRDLALPLSFLKPGAYQIDLWRDAPDAEANPNHLLTETLNSSPSDRLRIHLAADGGFVARLIPTRNSSTKY